jgi:hypothetical protein
MKQYYAILLVSLSIIGCTYTSTSVFTIDKNFKEVERTTTRITSELGMEKVKTDDSLDVYLRKNGNYPVYALRPFVHAQSDSSTKVTLITYTKAQDISDNLGKTFTSFYQQAIDSSLVKRKPDNFFRLEPKSADEMYRRTWISPPLGIYYVGKNNPFVEKSDNTAGIIGTAFFDALGLFCVVAGPFIGETSKDKVSIPIVGLLSLIGWRLLIPSMENGRELEEYNNIANSRYSLPVEVKRE